MNQTNSVGAASTYYEKDEYNSLEKFILAEDIEFYELNGITGKFYYNAMTPDTTKNSPMDKNVGGYSSSNYINLTIPTHLLLKFVEPKFRRIKSADGRYYNTLISDNTQWLIPKGTIFVGELIGGQMMIDKITLIGIYY